MKHYIIGIALALALVMGVASFAEATDPAPAVPAVTEEEAAPAEEETPADDDSAALQDALDAYRKAKQDKRVSYLEEELSEYVAAGSLTQEQADLILNSIKEKIAERNGECPNCGYDLRGTTPRQGGMRGGKMGQCGGMQCPDAQSGATPRQGGMQRDGMQNGQQQIPQMNRQMNGQMPGMAQPQM